MSQNLKEGWLSKKSKVIKNWKRRWFVLDENQLNFYEKPGKKQLGSIPLSNVVKVKSDSKKENAFNIILSSSKTYNLSSDTQEECADWISSLNYLLEQSSSSIQTDISKPQTEQPQQRDPEPTEQSEQPQPDQSQQLPAERRYSLEDFTIIKLLGRGSFGKVQLVKQNENGKLYAMKSMHKKLLEGKDQIQATILERNILLQLKHPFITRARYSFQSEKKVFLVLDYVSGGDLHRRIREEDYFNEDRCRLYAAEIALGLGYLHSNGYIYRDIKSSNILIDSDGHIKITDFGFTKSGMEKSTDTTSTFCGTVEYMAPEMILDKPYTKDVDWWGFGILLYEMLVGTTPFYSENPNSVYRAAVMNEPEFPPTVSQKAQNLIVKLLQKEPKKRLGNGENGIEDVKNDPFFDGLDWDDVLNKRIVPQWKPRVKIEPKESPIGLTRGSAHNSSVLFDSESIKEETQLKFRGFSQINFEEIT